MKLPGGAEHLRIDASTVAVWRLALGLASEAPQASRPGSSAPCGNTSTFPHTNITGTDGASASVVPVLAGAEVRPSKLTSRTSPNPLTSPGTWVAGAASALWSATPKNSALVYEMFRPAALESFSAFRTEDFRRLRPTARDNTAGHLQSPSETISPAAMCPSQPSVIYDRLVTWASAARSPLLPSMGSPCLWSRELACRERSCRRRIQYRRAT